MQSKIFAYILIIAVVLNFTALTYAQDNLEKYYKDLGSLEKAVRDKAASLLEKEGATVIPALKNLVTSDTSNVRQKQYALIVLAKVSDKAILPFAKAQFDAQKENIVKIECLNIAALYASETDAVAMLKSGVISGNTEIAMFAVQLAYVNGIHSAFRELLGNLQAKKAEQLRIASALAAASMYSNSNIAKELKATFVEILKKNISEAKESTEYKYQMTFALGYTRDASAMTYLIEIIKDQKFVNDVKAEIAKLEEEFKKTEEELKDKKEELEAKRQEVQTKINTLRDGIAEKQIRFNDMAAMILARYFGVDALENGLSEVVLDATDPDVEETFYVYAINCPAAILNILIDKFGIEYSKTEDADTTNEEQVKALEKNLKFERILKKAFVKHLFMNPESFKSILPLENHYKSAKAADHLLDCLILVSTPEITDEILKAFDENSSVTDEIKVTILSKFKAISDNTVFWAEITNFNHENVLKKVASTVLASLESDNTNIVAEALRVIKADSKGTYNKNLKEISENIKSILQGKDNETLIALGCEVLVKLDPGNAVKTMLQVFENVTNVQSKKSIYNAFADANFSSPQDITRFVSLVEKDLLDNEKDTELRKAAAKAVRKTNGPQAVELLTKSIAKIKESTLQDIEKYEFISHIVEQFGEMRNTARSAATTIMAEIESAYAKYGEIAGSEDAAQKQLQNTLTGMIRKSLTALQNIRNTDVIDDLKTLLNFDANELNIETLKVLKTFASDTNTTKKVLDLVIDAIRKMQFTGGIDASEEIFVIEALQVISDLGNNISGRTKIEVRNFNREMLAIDNIEILKKAITLAGALKDRRSRTILNELLEKHPELEAEINLALQEMK